MEAFSDIPIKFLLLAKTQCLVMFALKYLLENVHHTSIHRQCDKKEGGKAAMELACQVAVDLYSGNDISYLNTVERVFFAPVIFSRFSENEVFAQCYFHDFRFICSLSLVIIHFRAVLFSRFFI